MDRRQRKTREAIFNAFTELLSQKEFSQITVGEIIEAADVGRATFYSHFETKDFLLKELCEELFCHIFDAEESGHSEHRHIFDCDGSDEAFVHLFKHLKRNDNNVLTLFSTQNNELFLKYFRTKLEELINHHISLFVSLKQSSLPNDFWKNHIISTLIETIRWWANNGTEQSPEVIADYFFKVL